MTRHFKKTYKKSRFCEIWKKTQKIRILEHCPETRGREATGAWKVRCLPDGVRGVAGGAAVRARVAVEDGAGDAPGVVLERVRLVHVGSLAVRTAQRTRRPKPRRRRRRRRAGAARRPGTAPRLPPPRRLMRRLLLLMMLKT